jgi:hypothetical protein
VCVVFGSLVFFFEEGTFMVTDEYPDGEHVIIIIIILLLLLLLNIIIIIIIIIIIT